MSQLELEYARATELATKVQRKCELLETKYKAAREDADGLRKDLLLQEEVKNQELADQAKQLNDQSATHTAQLEAALQDAHTKNEALEKHVREQDRAHCVELDQQKGESDSWWDTKLEAMLGQQAARHNKEIERKEHEHQKQLETCRAQAIEDREFALTNQLKLSQDNHNKILAKELKKQEVDLERKYYQTSVVIQEARDRQALDLQKRAKDLEGELAESKKRVGELQADYDQLRARHGSLEAQRKDVARAKAEQEKTEAKIASESTRLEQVRGEVAKANKELDDASTELGQTRAKIASESTKLEQVQGEVTEAYRDLAAQSGKLKRGEGEEQSRWDTARERVRKLAEILCIRDADKVRKELLRFVEEEGIC